MSDSPNGHPPARLLAEGLGLHPVRERWRQTLVALRGEQDVPPSRAGLSSLAMLRPRMALSLWRRRCYIPRKVLLTNLFNHTQTPTEHGWSLHRTQIRDFRGRDMTYDSHNGTDLSIPLGTVVLTAAAGVVVQVISEFNRGGLKIFIDHGQGVMTCSAHMARAFVQPGDHLSRGQPIGLSGYSGLDGLITFPLGVPHVHFNTWLNGEPVDPFPVDGQAPLWRSASPTPPPSGPDPEAFAPSAYDPARVDEAIDAIKTPSSRERLRGIEDLALRAAHTIIEMNYYPTRFTRRVCVYDRTWQRTPILDLPFRAEDFDGAVFVDDL